jgi:hypothetical protein
MPADISGRLFAFDRFVASAGDFVSRAWFPSCVSAGGVVVAVVFRAGQTQHLRLIINTLTTIVTFLLVTCCTTPRKGLMTPSNTSYTPSPTAGTPDGDWCQGLTLRLCRLLNKSDWGDGKLRFLRQVTLVTRRHADVKLLVPVPA